MAVPQSAARTCSREGKAGQSGGVGAGKSGGWGLSHHAPCRIWRPRRRTVNAAMGCNATCCTRCRGRRRRGSARGSTQAGRRLVQPSTARSRDGVRGTTAHTTGSHAHNRGPTAARRAPRGSARRRRLPRSSAPRSNLPTSVHIPWCAQRSTTPADCAQMHVWSRCEAGRGARSGCGAGASTLPRAARFEICPTSHGGRQDDRPRMGSQCVRTYVEGGARAAAGQ